MSQSNADALKAAFAAADAGDPTLLVALYDDDRTWAGFTVEGTQRVYTKGEFLEAFGILAKLDEARNVVGAVDIVGDEIVTANIDIYRRLGDQVLDTTMVMVHRFVDGKVTRGADLVPSSFEKFWSAIGISG